MVSQVRRKAARASARLKARMGDEGLEGLEEKEYIARVAPMKERGTKEPREKD